MSACDLRVPCVSLSPKEMWLLCLLVPGLLQPQFVCSRGFRVCPGFEQSPPEESVPWGLGCLEAAGCSHGHELGSRSGLSPPPPQPMLGLQAK